MKRLPTVLIVSIALIFSVVGCDNVAPKPEEASEAPAAASQSMQGGPMTGPDAGPHTFSAPVFDIEAAPNGNILVAETVLGGVATGASTIREILTQGNRSGTGEIVEFTTPDGVTPIHGMAAVGQRNIVAARGGLDLAENAAVVRITPAGSRVIADIEAYEKENDPERVASALEDEDGEAAFEAMHADLDRVWDEVVRVLAPGGIACINVGDATRSVGGEFRRFPNHARVIDACAEYGVPLYQEPSNPGVVIDSPALDGYLIPTVFNSTEAFWITGAHKEWVRIDDEIDWDRTNGRVLTIEWIDGVKISNTAALIERGHNLEAIAEKLVISFLTQAISAGFFHADMHPGNIFVDVTDPARPSYIGIDCAIIGSLTESDQYYIARNLLAIFRRDYREVAELHLESGWIAPDPDNPDIVYGGSYGGYLSRLNHETGETRIVNVWPENPMGHPAKNLLCPAADLPVPDRAPLRYGSAALAGAAAEDPDQYRGPGTPALSRARPVAHRLPLSGGMALRALFAHHHGAQTVAPAARLAGAFAQRA